MTLSSAADTHTCRRYPIQTHRLVSFSRQLPRSRLGPPPGVRPCAWRRHRFFGSRAGRRDARNFADTTEEKAAITADLASEAALSHIAGPYAQPPFQHYTCSPLKTVPKKGNAAKHRIIHHLSYPHGRSINTFTAEWRARWLALTTLFTLCAV